MKPLALILAFLIAITLGLTSQTLANDCGSGLRCDDEGASCKPRYGNKGTCTQITKDGPGNVPDGCYCRVAQLILPPIWTFPVFEDLPLHDAYQARTELDQLQDDLDAYIMKLESGPERLPAPVR